MSKKKGYLKYHQLLKNVISRHRDKKEDRPIYVDKQRDEKYIETDIQPTKTLLVPQKYEMIMVLSLYFFALLLVSALWFFS